MGTPTQRYIDPLNGNDSTGDGLADGTAWKTTQHAFKNTTYDSTDGNQFNVKNTAPDTFSGALDLTTFTKLLAPDAPAIIRGYASVANDGGIGDLNGSGSFAIVNDTGIQWLHAIDMHLHNCGSAAAIWRPGIGDVIRCEVDTGSGNWAVNVGSFSNVIGCYIHDFSDLGVGGLNNGEIAYNYIVCTGDNINSQGIDPGTGAVIHHNRVKLTASGTQAFGIRAGAANKRIFNNSIWSNAGTGTGVLSIGDVTNISIYNNIVEGFSGTGGVGISTTKVHGNPNRISDVHSNAVFNCETAYALQHDEHFPYGDNETLSASPFADAANDDFTPQDVGNVITGFLSISLGPSGVAQSFPVKGALDRAQAVAAAASTLGNFDSFGG